MEIEKAIERLKYLADENLHVDDIKAIELAIEAAEKQVGKKSQEIDIDFSTFVCPNCSSTILYMDEKETHNHCLKCGQKLDWSDEQ